MKERYYTYFGGLSNIWTYREKDAQKIKVRYFSGVVSNATEKSGK